MNVKLLIAVVVLAVVGAQADEFYGGASGTGTTFLFA